MYIYELNKEVKRLYIVSVESDYGVFEKGYIIKANAEKEAKRAKERGYITVYNPECYPCRFSRNVLSVSTYSTDDDKDDWQYGGYYMVAGRLMR